MIKLLRPEQHALSGTDFTGWVLLHQDQSTPLVASNNVIHASAFRGTTRDGLVSPQPPQSTLPADWTTATNAHGDKD